MKGENSVSDVATSEKGAIIKTGTGHVARCFRRGRNQIIKSTTVLPTTRYNMYLRKSKCVKFIPEEVCQSCRFDI